MERQDRYGTGRAPSGPAELYSPWIDFVINEGQTCPHGPSFGDEGVAYYGTWNSTQLIKMDIDTGATFGSFQALNPVHGVPAIGADRNIYLHVPHHVGIPSGRAIRVNKDDMEFDWLHSMSSDTNDYRTWVSPILGPEGDVLLGSRRINKDTGEHYGFGLANATHTQVFTRANTHVISSDGFTLAANEWSTGANPWANGRQMLGAPGVAETGEIIVGSLLGVECLNPSNGNRIWLRPTVGPAQAAPAFSSDGVVYLGSLDWRIYAFRISDGARLWTFTGTGPVRTPPVVSHNGRIYFQDANGWVYGLSPEGGLLWSIRVGLESAGPMTIGPDGSLYVPGQGITVIRFSEQNLRPFGYTLSQDATASGELDTLFESDNMYLLISSTVFQPTQMTVEGQAPSGTANTLVFKSETGTKALDPVSLKTEFYNFASNSFEVVDQRTLTRQDGVLEVSRPAGNFIEGSTRRVRVRITFTANGNPGSNRIMYRVDQTKWTLR